MNYATFSMLTATSLLLCLSACEKHSSPTNTTTNSASSLETLSTDAKVKDGEATAQKAVVTDAWVGQWNGPEGTFLRISGSAGNYKLIIQNLDGPLTYTGIGVGEEIQFERNGIQETIHASNGKATGMKWLSDKSDCLTIRVGEGYCKK